MLEYFLKNAEVEEKVQVFYPFEVTKGLKDLSD